MTSAVRRQIPNAITMARLVLSVVLFVLLAIVTPSPDRASPLLLIAFVLYVVTAVTDVIDGHLARKWNVISGFGRVVDPFVDKILVLGCLLLLCGTNFLDPLNPSARLTTGIAPWMVLVLLSREMLVTMLRGMIESQGKQFPADWSGKIKMLSQCLAIGWSIGYLAFEPWLHKLGLAGINLIIRDVLIWLTILITALSAVTYCRRTLQLASPSGR
jgi:CDP-diacylglycerol---glycerol-3-phosphate 3-phosphatidyltransferase